MTDNTNRVLQDLKRIVDEMPTPAINAVLCKWAERLDYIDNSLKYAMVSESLIKEGEILRRCLAEIQSAYYIDHGNPQKGFKTLLNISNAQ